MKIILRADIDTLGRLGEMVEVKPGYARNYLIPQDLAMKATSANIKRFETERKKLQARMDSLRADAETVAEKLANVRLVIPVRVGEGDKLYGSVTNSMVGDALAEQGIEIDKRKILMEAPLRALGDYEVLVKLHPDVSVNLDVTVAPHGRFETDLPEEAAELIPEEAEAPEEEIGVTEPAEVQSESEAAEGESSEPEPQED